MDENKEKKSGVIEKVETSLNAIPAGEMAEKNKQIEERLFDFANFVEAKIALLYMKRRCEVDTMGIIERSLKSNKIIVLPSINPDTRKIKLLRLEDPKTELKEGPGGMLEPDPDKCKAVPIDQIDIAVVPGIAFDEKGSRAGFGDGFYDRLVANLPMTTRRVAISFEEQVVSQVPADVKQKNVDIIITEKRIIYKI